MVQWLGLSTFIARAPIQSLARELISHKPCSMAPPSPPCQKQSKNKHTTQVMVRCLAWPRSPTSSILTPVRGLFSQNRGGVETQRGCNLPRVHTANERQSPS